MRLVLLSGLGADGRLFREIDCPGVELVTPPHLEPFEGEALSAYARRVAERWGLAPEDAVGGASFGGMVAAEIESHRPAAALVLIGSSVSPRSIAAPLALIERASRAVADAAVRYAFRIDPRVVALVESLPPANRALLMEMFRATPLAVLRRGAAMIFRWTGASPRCAIHRIHGDRDRIIGARPTEVDVLVPGGGHLLPFSHPREVSAFIGRTLGGGGAARTPNSQ